MSSNNPLFQKHIEVRWADCDINQHMRHSAYADFCAHTRIAYLSSIGMTPQWFKENQIGPVLFKEEMEYRAEVRMEEVLRVTVESMARTEFSKSVQLVQGIYKESGELAALHKGIVGWMDLNQRKVISFPEPVVNALEK